jgi:hypothetical protein
MYCPSDVNTGFIELVGPIQQLDLNSITVKSYPLSISFAPRTVTPSLIGNRIDESTENTCTYRGKRFSLVDVQICSVANKNYKLPGNTDTPVAELILSFSANSSASDLAELSGILLCVPIYDSGAPSHADYLNQLIDPSIPSCDYTHLTGADYVGGDYKQISNTTLTSCIKSCCDDTNCLAYTFNQGTCYLKNSIPQLNKNADKTTVTGTINRGNNTNAVKQCAVPNCPIPKCNGKHGNKLNDKKSGVPNLETIFNGWEGDITQTSIAYKTCFETIDKDNQPNSRSLYVLVFPNGIHLTQSGYQQLLLQLNGALQPYMVPPAIRGGDSTLRSYKFDDEGNKVPTVTSQDGIIYSTPLSSCTDEFKHRFNYFTLPPKTPNAVATFNNEQSSYYKTTQYKCMPFNQLSDLSGNYVIPGNKTLDTILFEQQQAQLQQNTGGTTDITSNTLSTEQIETYIAMGAGVLIAGIIALKVGSWISNNA